MLCQKFLLCYAVCAIHPRPQELLGPELCLARGPSSSIPACEGEQPTLDTVSGTSKVLLWDALLLIVSASYTTQHLVVHSCFANLRLTSNKHASEGPKEFSDLLSWDLLLLIIL